MSNEQQAPERTIDKLRRETGIPMWALEIAFELSANGMLDEETMAGMRVIEDAARVIAESVPAGLAPVAQPPKTRHHKHCSSWTVNSGEQQPCDCVCECRHSMFQHIRPGEHYWYEDCAVEGCACLKFVAASVQPPSPQSEEIAKKIVDAWHQDLILASVEKGSQLGDAVRALPDLAQRIASALTSAQQIQREVDAKVADRYAEIKIKTGVGGDYQGAETDFSVGGRDRARAISAAIRAAKQ